MKLLFLYNQGLMGFMMLELPKVDKGAKNTPKAIKVIQKLVIGVAVSLGITVASLPVKASQTQETSSAKIISAAASDQTRKHVSQGTLVLTPHTDKIIQIAVHYSHSSHSSHYSHSSHHSHYSSRY